MTDFQHESDPSPLADPRHDTGTSKWLSRLSLALLVLGSVAGVWWLIATNPSTEPLAAPAETEQSTPEEVQVEVPVFPEGAEPIADAADKILPSVVLIDTTEGLGSGVVYDDGLILTAAHVVSGEETVVVRLENGENVEGTVLGGTSEGDIAVIRIEGVEIPPAELALDYTPRAGQMAIAVGSPWGLQSTVTAGIISAVNQPVGCTPGGNCRAMLQTDAAINPGNSGGALVDRDGRVLGINVSIFSTSGANDGVGFAVPIGVAYNIANSVVAGEDIEFAFLGVVGEPVESGRAGALITEVMEGSSAELAGIELDDVVVEIDGVKVQSIFDLASQVRAHRPGDIVDVVLVRDGEEITIPVELGVREDQSG